jgi:pentatricopeptide repeat-containing protein PET309
MASFFLLDFLYPRGAAAYLRRTSPLFFKSPVRSFTSTTLLHNLHRESADDAVASRTSKDVPYINTHRVASKNPVENNGSRANGSSKDTVYIQEDHRFDQDAGSQPDLLREVLKDHGSEYFEFVWGQLQCLQPKLQPEFLSDVMAYLARSAATQDAQKIISLIPRMGTHSWNNDSLGAVVTAYMRLDQVSRATEIFKLVSADQPLVGGLDELLTLAFKNSDWDMVGDIWAAAFSHTTNEQEVKIELPKLYKVPNLGELILQLREATMTEERYALKPIAVQRAINGVLSHVGREALFQPCKPTEALQLLKILDTDSLYKEYLEAAFSSRKTEGLAEIYRVYRKLGLAQLDHRILRGMFRVYYPNDVVGLEEVYEDYHRSYGKLDAWAVQKYMKFYALRGDAKSVERMWDRYMLSFSKAKAPRPNFFYPLLNVHAQRGNIQGLERVFEDMQSKYFVQPDIICWNILIKGYTRALHYEDAVSTLEKLCNLPESHKISPDVVTFGTVMDLSADRGDLDFTLELFERAKERKIVPTGQMISAVINAYCQNDRFKEAEQICIKHTALRTLAPSDYTHIWNILLRFHAMRRDLNSIHRILGHMSKFGLEWNSDTPDFLLQALVYCRQTHHAYHLLRLGLQGKAFPVTAEHFAIVMAGALRTREYELVQTMRKWMKEAGLTLSMDTLLPLLRSIAKRSKLSEGSPNDQVHYIGKQITDYFRQILVAAREDALFSQLRREVMWGTPGDVGLVYEHNNTISRALFLLAELRDFASIRELTKLYSELLEGVDSAQPEFSRQVLSSLMLADLHGGAHAKVKETWDILWKRCLSEGQIKDERTGKTKILAGYQYSLTNGLKVMQRLYEKENNGAALLKLVEKVTVAGFELDGKNWNFFVQGLARLGRWQDSFRYCEEMLMPNWTGWSATRRRRPLTLEQRRLGSAPRFVRPTSYTLAVLAKEYMSLQSSAPWSTNTASKLNYITENCPRCVHAIKTMVFSGSGVEAELNLTTGSLDDSAGKSVTAGSLETLETPISATSSIDKP